MLDSDPANAIIIGILAESAAPAVEVTADGKSVTVVAENEITLKCGRASITLRKDGRIVISGDYVISRARGTHRIRGGSVQIN
jgi:uncharacterized protein (DUF2345 family)